MGYGIQHNLANPRIVGMNKGASMKIYKYKYPCKVCGKTWESDDKKPLRCGKCKSPYWNKERRV